MTKVKVFYIFRPFRTWFLMNVFVTKNKTKKNNQKSKRKRIIQQKDSPVTAKKDELYRVKIIKN